MEGEKMILSNKYRIIDIADEYMAIPIGNIGGDREVIALSNAAGYLLKAMQQKRTEEDLVQLLTEEFDVDYLTAQTDVKKFIEITLQMGIINK